MLLEVKSANDTKNRDRTRDSRFFHPPFAVFANVNGSRISATLAPSNANPNTSSFCTVLIVFCIKERGFWTYCTASDI